MNDDQQSTPQESTELTNEWGEQPSDESQSQEQQGSDIDAAGDSQPVAGEETPAEEPAPQIDSTPVPDQLPVADPVAPPVQTPASQPAPVQNTADAVVPPAPGYGPQPAGTVPPVVDNPGKTLGIASIVLGVLALWVIGLPLAIISMVKSSKANAPKLLGIIGLVLNIIAIFVSAIILMMILIAIPALQQKVQEDQAAQTSSATTLSGDLISLDTDYMPTGGDVFFAVPASISGWKVTTIDKDGVNEFIKNDSSAKLMTYQGVMSGRTGTDRAVTTTAMDEYMTSLDVTPVSGSDSTVSFICMSDGKRLEFATKQVTTTSDGESLRGIVAVRMYEGHELSVVYLATAAAFSTTEWSSLTSKLEINDGVL